MMITPSPTAAVVWERSSVPVSLLAALDAAGFDDVERVAMMPEGNLRAYDKFWFMGSPPFATEANAALLPNGTSLWVSHSSGLPDDDDEELVIEVDWTPGAEDLAGALLVWRFQDTPEDWKWSAHQGGDEDWVTLVPDGVDAPSWLDEGSSYGCCSVEQVVVEVGTLHVGCHS